MGVCSIGIAAIIFHDAVVVGLLHYHTSHAPLCQLAFHICLVGGTIHRCNQFYLHAMEVSIGAHHLKHFGVDGR